MNNKVSFTIRCFSVTIKDERTGEVSEDSIVLTRQQLQAAQLVGQSSTELIYRIFNQQGYRVLDIGKPVKREISFVLYAADGLIVAKGEAGA